MLMLFVLRAVCCVLCVVCCLFFVASHCAWRVCFVAVVVVVDCMSDWNVCICVCCFCCCCLLM